MDLSIARRRALVTGSCSGIGYAIAEALAHEGAHVVLNRRNEKNLDAAVRRLQKAVDGAVCEAVVADASTAEGASRIVAAVPEVDILVNNLGKYERKDFFDRTDSDWVDFYAFNVLSGIRLVRAYGQGMRERKCGRVMFISSDSGILTPVEMINYGITKTAQAALARGLAREFGGCGVTVNAVLPGTTRAEGISTTLANESKRTSKSVRELEQEFLLWVAQLRSFSVCGFSTEPSHDATPTRRVAPVVELAKPLQEYTTIAATSWGSDRLGPILGEAPYPITEEAHDRIGRPGWRIDPDQARHEEHAYAKRSKTNHRGHSDSPMKITLPTQRLN